MRIMMRNTMGLKMIIMNYENDENFDENYEETDNGFA